MDLQDVAAISGKPGLFKVLKPTRNGVILESLDDVKSKFIANTNTKVSILKDISVYTHNSEGNTPLSEVLLKTHELFGKDIPVSPKSDETALRHFFIQVIPEYDQEKVYLSDIRKLVGWYAILVERLPVLFEKKEIKEEVVEAEETTGVKKAKVSGDPAPKKTTKTSNAATKSVKTETGAKVTVAKPRSVKRGS